MPSTPAAKATRILIVDDDADVHALYRPHLEAAGFDVHEAYTSSEAIARVRSTRPHLIVMDRRLPDGDGWELARFLKSMTSTARTPVIALSGMTPHTELERALQAGCDALLSKPCEPGVLVTQVRQHLDGFASPPTLAAPPTEADD